MMCLKTLEKQKLSKINAKTKEKLQINDIRNRTCTITTDIKKFRQEFKFIPLNWKI